MRGKIITFCLVIAFSNAVCAGDILRCVATNGDVSFTNMACPAKSQVEHVSSYEPVPDAPPPTYNPPTFPARQSHENTQQAYQAGYEEAQADQDERPYYDEPSGDWIPFYPVYGSNFRHHRGRHDRPWQPVVTPHAPRTPIVMGPRR